MLRAVGCVLHRSTSRVIHCSEIFHFSPIKDGIFLQAPPLQQDHVCTWRRGNSLLTQFVTPNEKSSRPGLPIHMRSNPQKAAVSSSDSLYPQFRRNFHYKSLLVFPYWPGFPCKEPGCQRSGSSYSKFVGKASITHS